MCLGGASDLQFLLIVMTGWAGHMRVYLVCFSVCVLCLFCNVLRFVLFSVCYVACAGAVAPDFLFGNCYD